jgi:hypothetical protein
MVWRGGWHADCHYSKIGIRDDEIDGAADIARARSRVIHHPDRLEIARGFLHAG